MSETKWQWGWRCPGSSFDECLIERLTWLGGRPSFGRRVLCRYHEVELSEYSITGMAGEAVELMKGKREKEETVVQWQTWTAELQRKLESVRTEAEWIAGQTMLHREFTGIDDKEGDAMDVPSCPHCGGRRIVALLKKGESTTLSIVGPEGC